MNYAVLWIPTITHGYMIHPIQVIEKEENISDKGNPFYVKLVFDPDTKNISVFYEKDEQYHHFVTLEYKDESRNGMIWYSYEDAELEGGSFRFTGTEFPEVIYHIIKGFYHKHDFHESKVDSFLKPFVIPYSEGFDFKSPNNPALLHYLQCYEKVLRGYVAMARVWFRVFAKKNAIDENLVLQSIPKHCLIVKGYGVYLNSLYNSRYNTLCRLHNLPTEAYTPNDNNEEEIVECETRKELRQLAFNIENAIKFFSVVEYEFNIKYQQKNTEAVLEKTTSESAKNMNTIVASSKQSTNWAIGGIVVSFLLSVLSIGYSVHLSQESSAELRFTKHNLDISIKDLSRIISDVSMRQDSLHKDVLDANEMKDLKSDIYQIEQSLRKIQSQISSEK